MLTTIALLHTLAAAKVRLALPRWLPPGYHAQSAAATPGPGKFLPEYHVVYSNGRNCFTFVSGVGGLGGDDLSDYKKVIVHNAFLKDPPLYYNAQTFFLDVVDQRAPDGRWYSVEQHSHWATCKHTLTVPQAVRVSESITFVSSGLK